MLEMKIYDFKTVKLPLKTEPMSYPACGEGLGKQM